jgi:hypothetical protein
MFRALRAFKLEGRQVDKFDLLPSVPPHLEGTFLRAGFIEPAADDLDGLTKTDLLGLAKEKGVKVPAKMRVGEIRELLKGV